MTRILALLLVAAGLCSCSVSEDDRDFYYKGWVNPNEPKMWNNSNHFHGSSNAPPNAAPYKSDPLVD